MNIGQLLSSLKDLNLDNDLEVTVSVGDVCFDIENITPRMVDGAPFILAIECKEESGISEGEGLGEGEEEVEEDDEDEEQGGDDDGEGD